VKIDRRGLLGCRQRRRADDRQIVHKGEFLVLDAGELRHFGSKAAFDRSYLPITPTGKNPGEKNLMQTVMDYTFPDQAACDRFYYSTDLAQGQSPGQLQRPVLGTWSGESYADVIITPNDANRTLWWDGNHVNFGFVNLGFVSWFQNQDPGAPPDTRAWPDVADLTDAELIFTVRGYDIYLPGQVRIGLWLQAQLPGWSNSGFAGPITRVYCNYFQTADLLDDALGFGGRGMAIPRTVEGVRFTPWRDWRVRLSPNDWMWRAMGTRLSKSGISYQPSYDFAYGAAPSVADILSAPIKANMGIMFAWPKSTPDVNAAPAPTPCPIFGRLQIKRVRLLTP
jgi:hypothetical protein